MNHNQNEIYRTALALLAVFLFWPLAGQSAPSSLRVDSLIETPPEPLDTPAKKTVAPDPKLSAKQHELHRLDFRIEGKSCPVCLLAIQSKLKLLNGVQDAAVMLKRPFGASVIYQADKASSDYILTMLKAKDPSIKIADVVDSKIDNVPVPLIPPFMPPVEPVAPVPDNLDKPMSEKL